MSAVAFPHPELVRAAKLSPTDLERTQQCRHLHTRLGFAYQLAFVRLAIRSPAQEPLEMGPDVIFFTHALLAHSTGICGCARRPPPNGDGRRCVCAAPPW